MDWMNTYQVANRLKSLNRLFQIVLTLLLICGLNYTGMQFFTRIDLSQQHRFSLAPETRAYINQLDDPVHFVVTIPPNSPREWERTLYGYVSNLLEEYTYASRATGNQNVTVEFVDIYKNLDRAESLSRKYGLEEANAVLVASGKRFRFLRAQDILDIDDGEPTAFKGEAAFTSALIDVTNESSPKLYFISGHGELSPHDTTPNRGLSKLTEELTEQNYDIDTLDLNRTGEIPADASLLVLADPQGPLLSSEVELLRQYLLDNAGRLLVWISPGNQTGLKPLFREWGIMSPDMVIFESGRDYIESTGNFLVRNFAEHDITESLINNQTFVVSGFTRPILPDQEAPGDDRLNRTPLLASSEQSWAEAAYRSNSQPEFNEESDIQGPVPLAYAAERKAGEQLGIKVPGGRLVVFGSGDFFTNQRLASLGNSTLFFNSLNWLLDRDKLLAIPPRQIEKYQLVASKEQLRFIAYLYLAVPGSIALLGLIVYWLRKL